MPAPGRAPELSGRGGWIGVDRPLSMAALRGRVVLLHFWASSSVESHRVIEELRPLEDLFADQLVVVGVHAPRFPREADHDVVVAAVARQAVTHPVLDDADRRTWNAYGVQDWPTVVVVDPGGDQYGRVSGAGCRPALEKAIREVLARSARGGGRRRKAPTLERVLLPTGPLAFPGKVASSADGRRLAIADTGNDRVLLCSMDGVVLEAHTGFLRPQGVRFDGAGVVVCDTGADRVVRTDGEVLADSVESPWDLVADGRSWVVAEAAGHRLVRVRPGELRVRLVAGSGADGLEDGPVAKAQLSQPSGVAVSNRGLVFVDAATSALRLVVEDSRDGEVSTLEAGRPIHSGAAAGGGGASPAAGRLQYPLGVAAHRSGDAVYIADTFNSALRVWEGGDLRTLPVTGLDQPGGLDLLPDGRLVVADTGHHRIVVVDPATGRVEPVELDETWVHGADGPPVRVERGRTARVEVGIDLVDEDLDLDAGVGGQSPVRVVVESRPAHLLGGGRREWTLQGTTGAVDVGGDGEGTGLLLVEVTARTRGLSGPAVRVQRRRHVLDVVPRK